MKLCLTCGIDVERCDCPSPKPDDYWRMADDGLLFVVYSVGGGLAELQTVASLPTRWGFFGVRDLLAIARRETTGA